MKLRSMSKYAACYVFLLGDGHTVYKTMGESNVNCGFQGTMPLCPRQGQDTNTGEGFLLLLF